MDVYFVFLGPILIKVTVKCVKLNIAHHVDKMGLIVSPVSLDSMLVKPMSVLNVHRVL